MSSNPTSTIKDKNILIIGGSGSLGTMLTKRYVKSNKIFIYSRGENNHWLMKQQFNNHPNLQFIVGDIRDKEQLETCVFKTRPNIIIIAAALKHIDICESNVNESINTNITGIQNIVDLISHNSMINTIPFVEKVLFVSTDKACAPVNVYGMCKAISERIMVEKTQIIKSPKFINVRYGNVLTSRGSIIPFFNNIGKDKQIDHFPVTDDEMTRYFMTLDQSVDLIEYALQNCESGDTVVPKNIIGHKIMDIAKMFSKHYDKPIKIVGIRPGEKIHETLISFTESLRTINNGNYYIIKPSHHTVKNYMIFPEGEFNSKMACIDLDESFNYID